MKTYHSIVECAHWRGPASVLLDRQAAKPVPCGSSQGKCISSPSVCSEHWRLLGLLLKAVLRAIVCCFPLRYPELGVYGQVRTFCTSFFLLCV